MAIMALVLCLFIQVSYSQRGDMAFGSREFDEKMPRGGGSSTKGPEEPMSRMGRERRPKGPGDPVGGSEDREDTAGTSMPFSRIKEPHGMLTP